MKEAGGGVGQRSASQGRKKRGSDVKDERRDGREEEWRRGSDGVWQEEVDSRARDGGGKEEDLGLERHAAGGRSRGVRRSPEEGGGRN